MNTLRKVALGAVLALGVAGAAWAGEAAPDGIHPNQNHYGWSYGPRYYAPNYAYEPGYPSAEIGVYAGPSRYYYDEPYYGRRSGVWFGLGF